jgi:5-formyltetrahydrofolate cyclo-ligase
LDQRRSALIAEEKRALRASLRAWRDRLSLPDRAAFARRITDTLLALPGCASARFVLAYMSMGAEFDTGPFIEQVLTNGQTLVLPRVNRAERRLDLYAVDDIGAQLAPGLWDIQEPVPARCQPVTFDRIDFALVPGLGFDASGGRLGYGGGYYDRLLARLPALRVAAAYSGQIVEAVPMSAHDEYVDLIVTEDGPIQARR